VFNSDIIQASDTYTGMIFGDMYHVRDAWSLITSNLHGVTYLQSCKDGEGRYLYELGQGYGPNGHDKTDEDLNLFRVFLNMFENVKKWDDFATIVNSVKGRDGYVKIRRHIENGLGDIYIDIDKYQFHWSLMNGHYEFTEIKGAKTGVYKRVVGEYDDIIKFYSKALYKNTTTKRHIEKALIGPNWYLFCVPIELEKILDIDLKNDNVMSDEGFCISFMYLISTRTRDLIGRLKFDVFKMAKYGLHDHDRAKYAYDKYNAKFEKDKLISILASNIDILKRANTYSFLREIVYDFKERDNIMYVPDHVTDIIFSENFVTLRGLIMPDNITSIKFGNNYNEIIRRYSDNLLRVEYGDEYNQEIHDNDGDNERCYLPDSVISIKFGEKFNKPIGKFPENLRYLEFGTQFDSPILELPLKVEHIKFGGNYNRSLYEEYGVKKRSDRSQIMKKTFKLPISIRHIELGKHYTKSLDGVLHEGLDTLIINGEFNSAINGLPSTLRELTLLGLYDQPVDNLPEKLEKLVLGNNFDKPVNKLPIGLKELVIGNSFNQEINSLPPGLLRLDIGDHFDREIENGPPWMEDNYETLYAERLRDSEFDAYSLIVNVLPKTLIYLKFGRNFNQNMFGLPRSLQQLELSGIYDKEILNLPITLTHLVGIDKGFGPEELPGSITHLAFHDSFNASIFGVKKWEDKWPRTLINLDLGNGFSNDIGHLPKYLTHLNLGKSYGFMTLSYGFGDGTSYNPDDLLRLPITLTHLMLGRYTESYIDLSYLINLIDLWFGDNFNIPLDKFPPNLVQLFLGEDYDEDLDNIPKSVKKITIRNTTHNQVEEWEELGITVIQIPKIYDSGRFQDDDEWGYD
jgi:hypothetical protein